MARSRKTPSGSASKQPRAKAAASPAKTTSPVPSIGTAKNPAAIVADLVKQVATSSKKPVGLLDTDGKSAAAQRELRLQLDGTTVAYLALNRGGVLRVGHTAHGLKGLKGTDVKMLSSELLKHVADHAKGQAARAPKTSAGKTSGGKKGNGSTKTRTPAKPRTRSRTRKSR